MVTALVAMLPLVAQADFQSDEAAFRKEYQDSLTRPGGWLSVAGLLWLREGLQTIGSGAKCDVKLPSYAPELVGTVSMTKGQVALQVTGDAKVKIDGQDSSGGPFGRLEVGNLTLAVIRRGDRTGLRLWDPQAKGLFEFKGCKWFAPSEKWVVKAKFFPHPAGTTLPITNVLGDTAPSPNPGYVEFTIGGKKCRLEAEGGGDALFFNFQDSTSGKETYPAGRFLDAPGPKDGYVTLDFNKATNPPCAFTAFATCPLPPKGNSLPVRVTAGELAHHPIEDRG